jgi:peptide chain release factor 3
VFAEAQAEAELVRGAGHAFDRAAYLAGKQTPVLFGSALNDFGVQEVLDTLVEHAPPPGSRAANERVVEPTEPKFSGVVFKIQANMDPAHRDRVVFVRVCSGRFERGMRLRIQRTGKEIRPNNVVSFLSQRRELLEEAYAGDIIGIPTHGGIQLGDTLTEGEDLQFTGLPFFAPEIFHVVEVVNPLKTKQLRTGLLQLGEEGAIQVFRPLRNTMMLLGAIGSLQFDVAAHRLQHEYGVEARMSPAPYTCARWISADDPVAFDKFVEANTGRLARDAADALAVLTNTTFEMKVVEDRFPGIRFHKQREHAGLMADRIADLA